MTIATFSLPIDIPWQRIAFSDDMMDPVACDRELPLRWRSSVAVFKYEPPEDQQRTDDFRVSYLKVSCTITGFQADGKEIRIRERLSRSGWAQGNLSDRLGELASAYYPCYGAILEVVVAPHPDDKRFTLDRYPYFADFDPKKRELYEVVSETGETMSRSLEDVNVRLGQTTLQSHEVRDSTTLGGDLSASFGSGSNAISGKGSASNTSGTTDLSQQTSENIRTTDAAREARETFSHTTQLSQMYHQLDSYHLGTNRAAFFVLPRPHMVQSPSTFVNGPREIEGVQEFMLVVVRPKEMEDFCVEAYLETAHLTGEPILDYGETSVQLNLVIDAPVTQRDTDDGGSYSNPVVGTDHTPKLEGYVIDIDKGSGGYDFSFTGYGDINHTVFTVDTDQVTVNGKAIGYWNNNNDTLYPAHLQLTATVYLKKKVPTLSGRKPGLMITGRAVCSCNKRLVATSDFERLSVVYEKSLPGAEKQLSHPRESMPIREANQLGAGLKREMLQSLSSADRYPRGTVGLLDSQLIAGMMGTHIRHADRDVNARLLDWFGIDKKLASRVTAYAPSITRSQMLEMPLARQVENFGLSFAETVELRRALTDIRAPKGPPPVPEPLQVTVPLLTGLQSDQARATAAHAGLIFRSITIADSPLPSGTVVAQEPEAGTSVEQGTQVSVQLATGLSVRLPELIGLRLSEAACRLRDAGLRSEPTIEGRPVPDAHVVALDPPAGTLVTPGTPVTISLSRKRDPRKSDDC